MTEVLCWDDVRSQLGSNPNLLLGNGFGRSLNSRFAYESLYAHVRNKLTATARKIFDEFETVDFEQVLRAVDNAELVNRAHDIDFTAFEATREGIRRGLIEAVLGVHPEKPSAIDRGWQVRALDLIQQFERVFTTNYDLLLYWLLMSTEKQYCDGFGMASGELRFDENFPYKARYFYLHGALHLFTVKDVVGKSKAANGKTLPETLGDTMASGTYPLFISEGTYRSKQRRIDGNPYLRFVRKELVGSKGALVTFGLAFWENDRHIAEALCEAPHLERLYVGVYEPSQADVERLSKVFRNAGPNKVSFFDTKGVL